ncbi:MAG: hypothetical protein IJW86_07220 [Clostridia bacterium]|nr:hypothetical protein [Clostridia bacterium]
MNIHKQTEALNPIAVFKLDNGVTLLVFDGYALGSDGKTYYHIGREDEEGDLITVGWSCEVSEPMIIE